MAPPSPRPLPPPTWDVVFPPNDLHPFLQDCALHAFAPHAAGYSPVNAWWLAELSLLAYSDAASTRAAWERSGLGGAGWQLDMISTPAAHAVVASGPGVVVVAFRGTQVPRPGGTWDAALRDMATDADLMLEPWAGPSRVHRGFARALEDVWSQGATLGARLDALVAAGSRVFFTGHSLGAALATLAAARWRPRAAPELAAVYTFGSPRVGDRAFAAALPHPVHRLVNNTDLIAHLPPPMAYAHVGELRLFDAGGRCVAEPDGWQRLREAAAGRVLRAQEWLRSAARGALLVPGDALVCHSPLYYALLAWNDYAALSVPGSARR